MPDLWPEDQPPPLCSGCSHGFHEHHDDLIFVTGYGLMACGCSEPGCLDDEPVCSCVGIFDERHGWRIEIRDPFCEAHVRRKESTDG